MFTHREIKSQRAKESWQVLRNTVSREQAFQATEDIGERAAEDMLEFSGENSSSIDRIFVKLRDGIPMASGMKKVLPNVDIQYIVSQEKQRDNPPASSISFFEDYNGYSSDVVWFADPINATGHTAVESIRYIRNYFKFDKVLLSHVAANSIGIKYVQTTLSDFSVDGYMNYAFHSRKLATSGYMEDGIRLTPDIGDKLFRTLGADYSVFNIQNELRSVIKTQAGKVELLKGTILHLVQKSQQAKYLEDRTAQWMTNNWIIAALQWYCAVQEFPMRRVSWRQIHLLINNLYDDGFLTFEQRPMGKSYDAVYRITEDGAIYTNRVYLPILDEMGLLEKIGRHYHFLIHLTPLGIRRNIADKAWR